MKLRSKSSVVNKQRNALQIDCELAKANKEILMPDVRIETCAIASLLSMICFTWHEIG